MSAGWVFLPVIGAPVAHGPVLRWDLAPALRRPISRQLFGANSFIKRRIGVPPGEQLRAPAGVLLSVFDQADWVPLAALLIRPIWKMSRRETAAVFGIAVALHVPINLIGYAIGARQRPI